MRHASLFSGIGGFDLAAQWMGWENIFHCEINEFCQKILKYYWKNAQSYEDITKTDFTVWRGKLDVLTGGFPCQPFSLAGKRKGTDDNRHLWPEMLRAIQEIQPKWIIGENVRGILNWNGGVVFEQVCTDLEAEGYEVLPLILPAIGVWADHIRERVWFVAYSNSLGWEDVQSDLKSSSNKSYNIERNWQKAEWWSEKTNVLDSSCNTFLRFQEMYRKPPIFDVDDGLPFELDGITIPKWIEQTMQGGGNAIVPQVVLQIFKAIEQCSTKEKSY